MRVVFSGEAAADLAEIGDYIAKGNARRALSFVRDLRAIALRLGDVPHAFPLVPRYEQQGIRRRPSGRRREIYAADGRHAKFLVTLRTYRFVHQSIQL